MFDFGDKVPTIISKRRELVFLILSNYVYKMVAALLDTVPLYILVRYLTRFLHFNPDDVPDKELHHEA